MKRKKYKSEKVLNEKKVKAESELLTRLKQTGDILILESMNMEQNLLTFVKVAVFEINLAVMLAVVLLITHAVVQDA